MQELLNQVFDHMRGMWRFRHVALLTTWVVALLGWLVVLALPPVYQATSRVYVDTTAVLGSLLEGIAVEQNVQAQLNYVRQAMLSRPQLETVASETDLDLSVRNERDREEMLDRLQRNIIIETVPNAPSSGDREDTSSLYALSVRDSDRGRALKTMQTLVNSFLESSLGGKRSNADSAQRFLREQIAAYEKRLAESESRLAEFKRQNIGMVPGEKGDYVMRLQNETDQVQRLDAQLRIAAQRRAELARQMSGERLYVPGAAGGGAEGTSRALEAQKRLDELLLRYTDKHPEVVAARETVEQLRQREAEELAALQRGQGGAVLGMASNPVYQQIQLQMNQTDVEIATLRSELAVHQQNIAGLRSMVDTAPEVEAEFTRLARDYDVTKARYNELLNRLDQANISEQADQTGIVRLEVIDPPTVGVEPVAPLRPQLLAMVFFAALLAGAGVAFLLHQLRPVFTSTRVLTQVTGLPVLGAVARTWVDKHIAERRSQLLKLASAVGALCVVFVLVMFVQDIGAHALQTLIRRI
jgi:polysaccharide chain length determinant protein (PEP-CTERM system associated)